MERHTFSLTLHLTPLQRKAYRLGKAFRLFV